MGVEECVIQLLKCTPNNPPDTPENNQNTRDVFDKPN